MDWYTTVTTEDFYRVLNKMNNDDEEEEDEEKRRAILRQPEGNVKKARKLLIYVRKVCKLFPAWKLVIWFEMNTIWVITYIPANGDFCEGQFIMSHNSQKTWSSTAFLSEKNTSFILK